MLLISAVGLSSRRPPSATVRRDAGSRQVMTVPVMTAVIAMVVIVLVVVVNAAAVAAILSISFAATTCASQTMQQR